MAQSRNPRSGNDPSQTAEPAFKFPQIFGQYQFDNELAEVGRNADYCEQEKNAAYIALKRVKIPYREHMLISIRGCSKPYLQAYSRKANFSLRGPDERTQDSPGRCFAML